MTKPLLSVAVPTFNRPESVLRITKLLVPQIAETGGIELLIIDNCSSVNISHIVRPEVPLGPEKLRIVRNPVNIGMAANFAACFLEAKGEWMWLLGDDDDITHNAIANIVKKIAQYPRSSVINFGGATAVPPIGDDLEIHNMTEFCRVFYDSLRLGTILFMSNNVYNLSLTISYIHLLFDWGYSTVPHAVPILRSLADHKTIVICPDTVAIYQKGQGEQHWNLWRYRMGISTLGEIPGCEELAEQTLPAVFRQQHKFPNWLISIPLAIIRSNRPPVYWRIYCFRLASVSKGLLSAYFILCGCFLTAVLKIDLFRRFLKKAFGERNHLVGMSRL